MKIDKIQPANRPSFGALEIIKSPQLNEAAKKYLERNILTNIQQAGNILGAPKTPDSTKFFDVILTDDNIDYMRAYKPVLIRSNYSVDCDYKNIYTRREYLSGSKYMDLRIYSDDNSDWFTLHEHEKLDNVFYLTNGANWTSKLTIYQLPTVAKIVKMLDEISKRAAVGESMSDPKVVIPEPVIPEIKKPMSFENLAQTYGVDEPLYGE